MTFVRIGLAALAAGVGGHQIWKRWAASKQKDRINELEQELAATKDRHYQEHAALRSRIKELAGENIRIKYGLTERGKVIRVLKADAARKELELAEYKHKALTFDFLEAWCHLEHKLKPLKHNLMQIGKSSDMHSQLSELHQRGDINERHFKSLGKMRLQRNNIVHHARLLKPSQARAYLGILKQVMGQV